MKKTASLLEAANIQVVMGGTLILDVPSLTIVEGEILSFIGPNGAGKTTLLQVLAHLIKLTKGHILFKAEVVGSKRSLLRYRRKLAMVFQEPLLFDTTVFENVAAGLKMRGVRGAKMRSIVREQLARFGISHLADRSARTLSGGEAQRTSLARAFATEPVILFLDEPFAALDPPTRESLIDDLERILRETGTTTVMATHDRIEALRLSDRIGIMNNGNLCQIGPPEDVMNRPADEFVASFVGTETILSGQVLENSGGDISISVADRKLWAVGEAMAGDAVLLCIRPENVILAKGSNPSVTSARNTFLGMIEKIIPAGVYYKVKIDCSFPLVAFITRQAIEELSLQEGSTVTASFKATAIHVIRRHMSN